MDPSAANVLLTGANGFAASHILDQLVDARPASVWTSF
jgi:thioester reductase-like protein